MNSGDQPVHGVPIGFQTIFLHREGLPRTFSSTSTTDHESFWLFNLIIASKRYQRKLDSRILTNPSIEYLDEILKGSCRRWGKNFRRNWKGKIFPFQTRRSETSVSYQWADKFSEPGHVLVPRKPRLKIQFLSATATILKTERRQNLAWCGLIYMCIIVVP